MSLCDDAMKCAERLSNVAKSEHGRWMGQGGTDVRLKAQIELMREAARLLRDAVSELENPQS